jgi:murein DD-endopeptidase MepM/ murein hydrolase activator NlpD
VDTGVDIVVPKGTPIFAAADGTVTYAQESSSGFGRLLKLDHGGGIETWYAHISAFVAHEGDRVTSGSKIAEVGQTGHATAPHLHYEVHENGEPVDPRPYLP